MADSCVAGGEEAGLAIELDLSDIEGSATAGLDANGTLAIFTASGAWTFASHCIAVGIAVGIEVCDCNGGPCKEDGTISVSAARNWFACALIVDEGTVLGLISVEAKGVTAE